MGHEFESRGLRIDGHFFLTPREALRELERGAVMVDIREPHEIMGRTLTVGAVLAIRRTRLAEKLAALPQDRGIIVADSTGTRSRAAALSLGDAGFERVAILAGGIVEWQRGGLPVEVDIGGLPMGSCACRLKPMEGGEFDGEC